VIPSRCPLFPSASELAGDDADAFELEEVFARAELRLPPWARAGLVAGRLSRTKTGVRKVARRLAFRRPGHLGGVTLCDTTSGKIVRLAFA
jgi:primosomal protein N'